MNSDDRDPVDILAEEFADLLRRGEHPSVGAYAAAHPDHAEQLKELLPAVAQMELLKRFRSPGTATEKSLPDRLGDFRIVRELGRGGMGVVFEAVQESLGRPVALKVLARHAQLDPVQRERFVREAQTAAKLHHTNIVPVFGVGEQDGLPYYVMQLIPGCGLHSVVRQWRKQLNKSEEAFNETCAHTPNTPVAKPTGAPAPFEVVEPELEGPERGDWRFIAGVGVQAAEALHYAHKQGVLHRDVKPANLILDGEIVWVADFGLAKLMHINGLTATGDILGTLQYLPPECLTGTADARSDVYGLGATLYELLTLEPPYAADSPAQLIKKVADADPPAPRTLNPDVPRDLETIVLKAMAREPGNRYATARDLARDLEAFLDDRPIKARRMTLVSRAWLACRRNPTVASLAFSTAAALVLAAVTGWVGYAREENRRKEAEGAKTEAENATNDARNMSNKLRANLKLSLETFAKVFEAASGNAHSDFGILMPMAGRGPDHRIFLSFGGGPGGPGSGGPGGPGGPGPGGPGPGPRGPGGPPGGRPPGDFGSDKAAILEAVLAFYDKFVEQNAPEDPQLQFEAAKASRRLCEANVRQRRSGEAIAAFRRAVALLEPLVDKYPDNEGMRTELVVVYLVAPQEAFPNDRDAPLRRAAELARGNVWLTGSVLVRVGLANEQSEDRPEVAESAYRDAIAAFTSVPKENWPPHGHTELGFVRQRLASALRFQGKLPAARAELEQSIREQPRIVDPIEREPGEGHPRLNPNRMQLADTYWMLVRVREEQKDVRAADEARAKIRDLGFPDDGPPGPFGLWYGGKKGDRGWGKKDGFPPKKN